MSDTYSRGSVLRSLLPDHKHRLVHLDPPDFEHDLTDEVRRAIMNAAFLNMTIDKERFTADLDRLRALNDAFLAERCIADACLHLDELRTTTVN